MKTGGLADVAGSLPNSLNKMGCDVRVVLPKYGFIDAEYMNQFKHVAHFTVALNNETIYCGVDSFKYKNVMYYFIDNEMFYKRDYLYGYGDEGARFAFFSKAILEMIAHIRFKPDIIHINDWHVGLLPLFLKVNYQHLKLYQNIKTVISIHNIHYQGSFDRSFLDYCMINQEYYDNGTTRHDYHVNFLKTGIMLADSVTTVSETYAEEIKTPTCGEGLNEVLTLKGNIIGITNGIDEKDYNPKQDKIIKENYDSNHLNKKAVNKAFLQKYFSLPEKDIPVVIMITRLVEHKGLDFIIKSFYELMNYDFQLVILGCGEAKYEHFFYDMSKRYKDKVRIALEFNSVLARFMYAGADFLLMPSIFEPCGLAQMIAMRYGTLPIIRQTGGLKDTVEIFDEKTLTGCGFGFNSYNELELVNVIKYAFEVYQDKSLLKTAIQNAMNTDFSWQQSSLVYKNLYHNLLVNNTMTL